MSEFLQYQDQTSQYYSDLMRKLERMNGTLGVMLHYLDSLQVRIEERLHIIQGYVSWTGLSLRAMWTCVAHTGYFALGAVLLTFLRCSAFSRLMLMLVVPLNAAAEINQQPALDLTSLSLLLLTASLGHWLVNQLRTCFQSCGKAAALLTFGSHNIMESQKETTSSRHSYPSSSTPQRDEKDEIRDDLLNRDGFLSDDLSISAVSPPPRKSVPETVFMPILGALNHSTPRMTSRAVLPEDLINNILPKNLGGVFDSVNDSRDFGSDSRSESPAPSLVSSCSLSGRQLCNGVTKTGKACKKRAVPGQEYCRVHGGGVASSILKY